VDVPKGDIECRDGKTSVGADKKGGETEEGGMEEVGKGDIQGVVHIDFIWHNSQESQGCLEELVFGYELD
jgi:hypothetical protein